MWLCNEGIVEFEFSDDCFIDLWLVLFCFFYIDLVFCFFRIE